MNEKTVSRKTGIALIATAIGGALALLGLEPEAGMSVGEYLAALFSRLF